MGIGWKGTILIGLLLAGLAVGGWVARRNNPRAAAMDSRQEVVFWHFWGGADREVVEDVVNRFNDSQARFRVRAVAMPGNNLQAKLFLSIAGGDPPDIVNQDDPVVGEWASRGFILPLDEIATAEDVRRLIRLCSRLPGGLAFSTTGCLRSATGWTFGRCITTKPPWTSTAWRCHGRSDDLDTIAHRFCPPDSTGSRLENVWIPARFTPLMGLGLRFWR